MENRKRLDSTQEPYLTTENIASILNLKLPSAKLYCSRAAKRGDLIRIKRGLYLKVNFEKLYSKMDFLRLSNILQTPSYISLLTALAFYDISTQMPHLSFEAISKVRTVSYTAGNTRYVFFQTNSRYYFGFTETNGIFIAEPEKAIVDAAHLCSFGKYAIDLDAINFAIFDYGKIEKYLKKYPLRTKNLMAKWRNQYGRLKTS